MDQALLCLTHINSFILHSSVRYYYYIHITDEENEAQKGQKLKPQIKSREFWLESLLLNILLNCKCIKLLSYALLHYAPWKIKI